ncbi:MAG: hypothetical protein ACOX18_05280 [Bacillota bacterium]
MSFIERLQNIDRRVIYVLLMIAVTVPLVSPLGIPINTSNLTKAVYNLVDGLEEGDTVLFSLDYSAGSAPEVHPQAVAIMKHVMNKGVKVVLVSFWDAGPMFGEQLYQPYLEEGKVYGEDFVNLGYISGGETAIRNFGHNIPATAKVDFHNNSVADMPIMQGIKDARDFALVIDFVSGNPGLPEWVRQVQASLNINLCAGAVTVEVPQTMPFVQSGQVKGLLQGLRGAAEYELLMEIPGGSVSMMDAQSLGHMVIIGFILLGNVAFLLDKNRGK